MHSGHFVRLRKVWVCGPPKMNETFDRAFDMVLPKYQVPDDKSVTMEVAGELRPWQIDIL